MQFKNLIVALPILINLGACSSNSSNKESIDMRGQWYIENIVFNDSVYVRPSEEVPESRQYIVFEDETYFIQTNCNTMSGYYSVKGDSIFIGDGAMTEMACDNMATEDALRKIIPHIMTIDVETDTITRLNSGIDSSEYIILRKATEKK